MVKNLKLLRVELQENIVLRAAEHKNIERGSSITAIRHAIKRQLVKYKGDRCIKCGYNKCIGALQFHHKDRNIKDFDLASQYNGGHLDMEVLYKEVDKCDLLCANCHAEEHFYN